MTEQTNRIIDELIQLDREWATAEVRADRTALESLLTDQFVGVGPRGFLLTKSEWLDRHASGDLKYQSITVDDLEARLYGDAALVTCVQNQNGAYQSHDVSGSFRASQLMVRDGDRWRIASIHLSPLAGVPNWVTAESGA